MNCYIKIDSTNKAKQDIDTLMAGMGFRNIAVRGVGGRKAETFMRKVFSLVHSLFVLKRGDVLVMQYPYKKFYALQCRAARFKGARTITLIHDLGTFRRRKLTAPQEMRRLSHTDYIIAHNDRMKQWLVEHGRDGNTVGTLGIFDYLSKSQISNLPLRSHCSLISAPASPTADEQFAMPSAFKFQISNNFVVYLIIFLPLSIYMPFSGRTLSGRPCRS